MLSKFAAQAVLKQRQPDLTEDQKRKISIMYQVLHSSTAFVGVVKKKKGQETSDQEMIKIDFDTNEIQQVLAKGKEANNKKVDIQPPQPRPQPSKPRPPK